MKPARMIHAHPARSLNRTGYPGRLWILFVGSLITMTAQSLVWPFLTIHITRQLGLPLTQITLLFTVQSVASLAGTAVLGPAMDRFGRKWAMVLGPVLGAAAQLLMIDAATMPVWGVLMAGTALGTVAFRTGANAMIADLVAPERRAGAYALLRMGFNIGIAVGPGIGGALIEVSYALSFTIAAVVQMMMAALVLVTIRDSLAASKREAVPQEQHSAGYGPLLRDRAFMSMWSVYLLIEVAASMVFTLLAVYLKDHFGIPERDFGLILGTNAAMVVLFQFVVTRFTERRAPFTMMALGAGFYALGLFGFAVGWNFLTFWLGMVV
ncbi:MAG: MFS transporter, partial [Anaerolineae bacterium]|nr:MFS transporter [Anaerolineae bacterium]